MAFGEMGLTPTEFYTMTPCEFFLAVRGHNSKEWKKWGHTRTIAYTTYAMAPRKRNQRAQSMFRWMPLPTDNILNKVESQDKMKEIYKKLQEKDHG